MSTLADTVEQILAAMEAVLTASPEEAISSTPSSVRVLLGAGEDVVAYEALCENLYEIDAHPPVDLVRQLRQAVVNAGADPALANLFLR